MNDCPRGEIRDQLPDLLTGSLDDRTRALVEQHVSACAECAAELAVLRQTRTVLSRGPAVDPARIAAAVRSSRRRAINRTPERAWRVAALAAGIVLMVMGALWVASARQSMPELASGRETPAGVPDSAGALAPVAPSPAPREVASDPRQAPAPAEVPLAVAFADVGDAELEALLDDIRALDGVPEAEPLPDVLDLPINGEVQR